MSTLSLIVCWFTLSQKIARCGKWAYFMKTIKVYCNDEEKQRIQAIAEAKGLTSSKYLLQVGLRQGQIDLPERALLAQLVSYMVQLVEDEVACNNLLAIAQDVLEGGSIKEARVQIAEICKDDNQGS